MVDTHHSHEPVSEDSESASLNIPALTPNSGQRKPGHLRPSKHIHHTLRVHVPNN